jgi:hypothetical protein
MCKCLCISVLIMILGADLTAYATADGPDTWCVKNVKKGDFLNLRNKPSLAGSIIGRIPPGTCDLKNAGPCVGRNSATPEPDAPEGELPKLHWCPIKWNDKRGWASLIYLEEHLVSQ